MQAYYTEGTGEARLLVLQANSAHRFKFTEQGGPIRFKRVGARLLAVVTGSVKVYKKPTAQEYHREYMQHSARAMWCGMQADPDRLLDNMLEYVETI